MGFECIALCPSYHLTMAFSLSLDIGVGSRIFFCCSCSAVDCDFGDFLLKKRLSSHPSSLSYGNPTYAILIMSWCGYV